MFAPVDTVSVISVPQKLEVLFPTKRETEIRPPHGSDPSYITIFAFSNRREFTDNWLSGVKRCCSGYRPLGIAPSLQARRRHALRLTPPVSLSAYVRRNRTQHSLSLARASFMRGETDRKSRPTYRSCAIGHMSGGCKPGIRRSFFQNFSELAELQRCIFN